MRMLSVSGILLGASDGLDNRRVDNMEKLGALVLGALGGCIGWVHWVCSVCCVRCVGCASLEFPRIRTKLHPRNIA